MTSTAHLRLHLDSGDTQLRLARFALDSAQVRTAWRELPEDVRLAQTEMNRLAQTQIRVGHMRQRERDQFAVYQDRVSRHHEHLVRSMDRVRGQAEANPYYGWYGALKAHGNARQWRQAMQMPEFEELHGQMQILSQLGAQRAAIMDSDAIRARYGADGQPNFGQAAGYWMRRATFGTGPDGETPRTAGQWAKDSAVGGFNWVRNKANQVAGLFTIFEGIRMVTRSMEAYEEHAETVQDLGARLGGNFSTVTASLAGLRKQYALTLHDIRSGLTDYARLTGTVEGSEAAVRFARATGLSPNAVLGQFGHMAMYGPMNAQMAERAMGLMGFNARPETYLGWLGATTAQLGHGMYQVGTDAPLRYMGLVAGAFGSPYMNERGQDVTQRLLGGMMGAATGGDPVSASRLHAVRRMDRGKFKEKYGIDIGTYWGMQEALESGAPEVLEALYGESVRLGGGGEMGQMAFKALAGRGLNFHENRRVFRHMRGAGGKMLTEGELMLGPDLSDQLAAVQGTEAYKMQALKSAMETDVYEPIGEKLKPISMDFKEAARRLAVRLAESTDAFDLAGNALLGIGDAVNYLRGERTGSAAHYLFEFSLFGGSMAEIAAKQAAIGAAQGAAAAQGARP